MRARPTGHPTPRALREARRELHQAAVLVASVAPAWLPPRADGAPHPLRWIPVDGGLLASPAVEAARPFAVAVRARDLSLLVLDAADRPVARLPLGGETLAGALGWLLASVEAHAGAVPAAPLTPPSLGDDDHPVAAGAPFGAGSEDARRELGRWFTFACDLLELLADELAGLGAPRVDPLRLELAARCTLAGPGDPRTVELAFVPDDPALDGPALVVRPLPGPRAEALPPLAAGGEWHRGAWTGAVLPAEALLDAADPARSALAFLRAATDACRVVLPRPRREIRSGG